MYCPRCGVANDDAARFCSSCGSGIGGPSQQQTPATQAPAYQQSYQQQYQQPYQAPRYPGAPGYGAMPNISSHMGWAIAVLILCFWPTGIAAVVNASRVGNRLAIGDMAGAQESSRKAKMWCWITFGIGVACYVLSIVLWIFVWRTAVDIYDLDFHGLY